MFTFTGTVEAFGKYLVTGMPFNTEAHTPLRLAFENNTAGTNLALCAGSDAGAGHARPLRQGTRDGLACLRMEIVPRAVVAGYPPSGMGCAISV